MKFIKDTSFLVKPSNLFILFCICFSVVFMDAFRTWHYSENNFIWDVANYYSYLPATFCNNGSFEFNNGAENFLPISKDGVRMPKVTYGMSLLYSPFFALGYKVALNSHEPLTGFSEGFAACIHWGSIAYALIGLILLRNFLIKFYSETVTTITLVICFFGTMLFHYTYADSEMSHGYLFFLISAFLLTTYHWYNKVSFFKSLLIGLLLGIISLIRPTEILVSLLFVLWKVNSWNDIKERAKTFWNYKFHLLLMLVAIVLIWTPQFLFWKNMTGNYFYFSYGDERFFWSDPQLINILFSYRKGWITYTPLIVLAFIGFFFMRGEVKKLRLPILALLLINIYVLSCWWDWFFGGCFGARGFCQHIAFLSIPLASCVEFFVNKENFKPVLRFGQAVFFAVVCFGVCLNIGQTNQYIKGLIHFNSMTKETYWLVWGKYTLEGNTNTNFWKSLKEPDYDKLKSGENRNQ